MWVCACVCVDVVQVEEQVEQQVSIAKYRVYAHTHTLPVKRLDTPCEFSVFSIILMTVDLAVSH